MDSISWILTEDGNLTISGEGEITKNFTNACDAYKDQIKKVEISNGITEIGNGAFYSFSSLTEVNLPDSVEIIGTAAFSGCSAMKEINLPDSLISIGRFAFMNCSSLLGIEFPENITYVPAYAFYGCTKLQGLTVASEIDCIGDYAFSQCPIWIIYVKNHADTQILQDSLDSSCNPYVVYAD